MSRAIAPIMVNFMPGNQNWLNFFWKNAIWVLTPPILFDIIPKHQNKCECAGTGRQARLRGVCLWRTGSSPVTRTKFPKQTFRFGLGIFLLDIKY